MSHDAPGHIREQPASQCGELPRGPQRRQSTDGAKDELPEGVRATKPGVVRRYSRTVSVRESRLGLSSGWYRCSLPVTRFSNDPVGGCLSSDLSERRGRCRPLPARPSATASTDQATETSTRTAHDPRHPQTLTYSAASARDCKRFASIGLPRRCNRIPSKCTAAAGKLAPRLPLGGIRRNACT